MLNTTYLNNTSDYTILYYTIHIIEDVLNSNLNNFVHRKGNINIHTTSSDSLHLSAGVLTPSGLDVVLKPNETIIATYGCNNRTTTANIAIGFGADTKDVFTFFTDVANIAQWGSCCATFVFTNMADYDMTIYGLLQSNVDIDVMFIMCDYIIIK